MKKDDIEDTTDPWFQVEINGDDWTIYLAGDDDSLIASENSDAETDFHKREIVIRQDAVNLKVIRHELWHAYMGYTYLEDTNINSSDAEEVAACLFSDRGEKIIDKSHLILAKLKALKASSN